MTFFRDLPIRRKLTLALMLSSGLGLMVAFLCLLAYELGTFRNRAEDYLRARADLIGATVHGAVAFDDPATAQETLATLRGSRDIVWAALYGLDGKVVASYHRDSRAGYLPSQMPKEGAYLQAGGMTLRQTLQLGDEPFARLCLRSDLGSFYQRLARYGMILALVIVVLLGAAWKVSRVLQRALATPILNLAQTAQAVTERKDYSLRVGTPGADELGRLADAFNEMLATIAQRDAALRQSEEKFRSIVETTSELIWATDLRGVYTYVNPAAELILGYRPEDLVGRDFLDHVHEADQRRIRALMPGLIAGRRGWTGEVLRWRHKDGTHRHLESNSIPIIDASGELLGFRGADRDITERRRSEDQIRALNETLERRVLERTAQLEEALKELESFSYSVSHDLRAPLRHVSGFARMLLQHPAVTSDARAQHLAGTITEAAAKMGRLIDDLLAFSKMGRAELRTERINLEVVVDEVRRDFQPELAGRDVSWKIERLPPAHGDAAMLRLVMQNLIGNALKYSRNQPRTVIEIGSRTVAGADETVVFVRDNGVGFDMKYGDKLFGVFQRLHRDDEFEGTGIGLANVLRIVTRHGGRTWAEGRPGQGATFYFSLPVRTSGELPP
jgi:PAS domain S-box-containing protein